MAGAVSDSRQLLELLKRAADELKLSQQETASARADAETFAKKLMRLEAELKDERQKVKALQAQLEQHDDAGGATLPPLGREPLKTNIIIRAPLVNFNGLDERDDRTNVSITPQEVIEHRLRALQEEFNQADAERRALKDRIKLLESERPEGQEHTGESDADVVALRDELAAEHARVVELEAQLTEARSGLADHEALMAQSSQLEAELTSASAKVQALEAQLSAAVDATGDEHKALRDAQTRIAQLEAEGAGLRARRDELNGELGHVEKERNALRAKVADFDAQVAGFRAEEQAKHDELVASHQVALGREAAARAELEAAATKEKEKHQQTAQKLLEARARIRDLEVELEKATAATTRIEGELLAAGQAHQKLLREAHLANERAGQELRSRLAELERQLEHAMGEWRHVDRQYEQLHKEMIILLDQRDEARRELEALVAEKEANKARAAPVAKLKK